MQYNREVKKLRGVRFNVDHRAVTPEAREAILVRPAILTALPIVEATGRAYPWAEAKGQDLRSVSIVALRPEEIKGQNDLPQLPIQMSEVRERPEG
jgi:hypothetical protein